MSNIYTVSQVNQYIKALLDRDRELTALYVRGEISNYKAYPSGHHYFSLKDGEGAIRCVMFKREAMSLRFRPENGMKVIAFGRVAVFPRDGQYQLYCTSLTPEGVGDLHLAFEQLKQKLYAEGLFDPAHKKPIPRFPKRIALITSAAVATCGMVGWIGLVIPHLMRMLVGPDYRTLLPASLFGGALFLLMVDNITRVLFQVEVSIGILTALVGAPFFLILLARGRRGWV